MICEIRPIDLRLKRDFVIAGGRASVKRNYIVVLEGYALGEAAGSVHYGATAGQIEGDLTGAADEIGRLSLEAMPAYLAHADGMICRPAMCALSMAYDDFQARMASRPLSSGFDIPSPPTLKTSVTASVGDIGAIQEWINQGFAAIKVKMDADLGLARMVGAAMRRFPDISFRIDANGSWTFAEATRIMALLPAEQVQLLEQPFPSDAVDDWLRMRAQTTVPLVMDESIETAVDVERAAGYVDGVNVKLQKSGRLETAVEAMTIARRLGLKIMLGCMIESSVGVAAAYQLSSLADWLDLDGRLLIENDPFSGLMYQNGSLHVSGRSGHGVSLS